MPSSPTRGLAQELAVTLESLITGIEPETMPEHPALLHSISAPSIAQQRRPSTSQKESSLQSTLRETRDELTDGNPSRLISALAKQRQLDTIRAELHKSRATAERHRKAARAAPEGSPAQSRSWAASEAALDRAIAHRRVVDESFGGAGASTLFHDAYVQRSHVHVKRGKPGQALADAESALDLAPRSTHGARLRGRSLLALERFMDAATVFEEALQQNPSDLRTAAGLERTMLTMRRARAFPAVAPPPVYPRSLSPTKQLFSRGGAPAPKSSNQEMDDIFASMDVNGDGEISSTELASFLRLRGYTDEATTKIKAVFDRDGDDTISRAELRTAFLTAGIGASIDDLLGKIAAPADVSFADLRQAITKSGERLPPSRGSTIRDDQCRGISLPQLRAVHEHVNRRCAPEGWTDFYGQLTSATTYTLYDVVTRVIAPATHARQCSYVELVADEPQRPLWMVAHWWGEPAAGFLRALEQHTRDRELDDDGTCYWCCAFARNQHVQEKHTELESSAAPVASCFRHALETTVGTVLVVDPSANIVNRVWPLYEVLLTLRTAGDSGKRPLFDVYVAHDEQNAVGFVDDCDCAEADLERRQDRWSRERAFPPSLLERLVSTRLDQGEASAEDDRRFILNSLARRSDLTLKPFAKHASYDAANRELRGRFAAYALRAAVEAGGPLLSACLGALQSASTLRELHVSFAHSEAEEEVISQVLRALPLTLEELSFTDSATMESADAVLSLSAGLQRLSLAGSLALTHIPPELSAMAVLRHLNLSDCSALAGLPDSIGLLRTLTSLCLAGCTSLSGLPTSLSMCEELCELDLFRTPGLTSLPNLQALTKLDITNCLGDGRLFVLWMAGKRKQARAPDNRSPESMQKRKSTPPALSQSSHF